MTSCAPGEAWNYLGFSLTGPELTSFLSIPIHLGDNRSSTLPVQPDHILFILTLTLPIESSAHDSGRTLVRAEYGYLKGSPNTNS
jgi:hypothetical protein